MFHPVQGLADMEKALEQQKAAWQTSQQAKHSTVLLYIFTHHGLFPV